MSSEDEKRRRELAVFSTFLLRSAIPIDPNTVEVRKPPEPDILCRSQHEGLIAFELVELCDPNIALQFNLKEKDVPDSRAIWTSDPSTRIFKNKLAKRYVTNHPVELLCYSAGRLITPDDVIISTLLYDIEVVGTGIFRRVWFMGETVTEVLFHVQSR
jgi:hypothetical protein